MLMNTLKNEHLKKKRGEKLKYEYQTWKKQLVDTFFFRRSKVGNMLLFSIFLESLNVLVFC